MNAIAKILTPRQQPLELDIVILIIRLIVGYAFMIFGWGKIQNAFNWMPADHAAPAVFQALAAVSEFCGGIALIIGFLTRIASFGIVCTMIGAVYFHKYINGDPFINLTGGASYQIAVTYLLLVLVVMVYGAGRFSLEYLLFRRRE
jgi:putative oxidoreductase